MPNNIPLRQRGLVAGTGWGRLDADHGLTQLLYETGGIAVVGSLSGILIGRDQDRTRRYPGTLFSDGINALLEHVEEFG